MVMTRQEYIEWQAGIAHMDIHRQAHEAMRQIRRMAEFPARSAGQKRRYQREKESKQ